MKSRSIDRQYHEARAAAEMLRARESGDPAVAAVHRELAALHRRRMLEIIHLGEAQVAQSPLVGGRQMQHDIG